MNKGSPLKRGKARIHGGVAQLGEHLPCKQGVKSSNLSISICASESRRLLNGRFAVVRRAQHVP